MSVLSASKRGPILAALAVACALWAAPAAFAQDAAPPAGGGAAGGAAGGAQGGNRGSRGNFDPAQMRERMNTYMKERLGASDDEWKVLQPKLEKIQNVQRDARSGGFGGRDRNRSGDNNQPTTPVAKASADLRTALENKDTPADDINKKLTALREAREKAKTDLVSAQKELKEVLTPRQEAVLVTMGMLD